MTAPSATNAAPSGPPITSPTPSRSAPVRIPASTAAPVAWPSVVRHAGTGTPLCRTTNGSEAMPRDTLTTAP